MSGKLKLKSYTETYKKGLELNVAPFDEVVSFIFRHKPDKPKEWTRILEVGCGAGNNLFWLAQAGFQVFGVEISADALEFARGRFDRAMLTGNFFQQSFTDLPWKDQTLDMAIDRAALSYVTPEEAQASINEIHRVLVPGGKFLFTPYTMDVNGNTAYSFRAAQRLLDENKWNVLCAERVRVLQSQGPDLWKEWQDKESHYRIVAERR